jgi:hypothetical protein
MTNRILVGIDKARALIALKNLPPEQTAELAKNLDMGMAEYARFQELKSGLVGVRLNLDEANTIYGFLGNTVEHFNKQPLAVKWVLTEFLAILLKR